MKRASLPLLGRRAFITLLGGSAAWPLAARGQQAVMPVVGFLRSTSANASTDLVVALRRGLAEAGYTEGQNIAIEYRWAENPEVRLPELADDLVRRQCALIIAAGDAAAQAAKAATMTIPIVFATGEDPVKVGLVSRLNRPGSNITGISFYNSADLESKQLALLREVVPKAAVIGLLVNPTMAAAQSQESDAQVAARALGLQLFVVNAGSERDFDTAFATLARERVEALLIAGNALFTGQRDRLVALAARYALPTIYPLREAVAAGGLMSYGTSITDAYRQAGIYAGRILKGEKPGDLPVMLPTKFELVINLKTAKALGLNVPDKLLALADEAIE
jgi:putative tryptophan/tyrosine transport system substrate-binding protein